MLPAEYRQVLDTWGPDGLAGSGSHDYTIEEDTFVPEDYTWIPGQHQRPEPCMSGTACPSPAVSAWHSAGPPKRSIMPEKCWRTRPARQLCVRPRKNQRCGRVSHRLPQWSAHRVATSSTRWVTYPRLSNPDSTSPMINALAGGCRRTRRNELPRRSAVVGRHGRFWGVAAVFSITPTAARPEYDCSARINTKASVGLVRSVVLRQTASGARVLRFRSGQVNGRRQRPPMMSWWTCGYIIADAVPKSHRLGRSMWRRRAEVCRRVEVLIPGSCRATLVRRDCFIVGVWPSQAGWRLFSGPGATC